MKKLLFISFIAIANICNGQGEGWHWYFGDHAGLDFTSGSPVVDLNSAMYTDEGCASISDASGLLQFYTDGTSVWNRNHLVMVNGTNLNGSSTSSQSAMIAKQPGNPSIFYIFTTDGVGGPKGLCYSTVDMSLQGGLGEVVIKNTQLMSQTCENLTATFHANGNDVWVMAHDVNGSNYYAYLLTSSGVAAPVINNIGTIPPVVQASMKFSPQGDRLARPYQGTTRFEVMDFDNSTGILSNLMTLDNPNWTEPFAVEFSPSGRFLYGAHDPAGMGILVQFDLSLGTQAAITAAAVDVGTYTQSYFGSLQLGPDYKLYAGELGYSYIGVVNYPDSPGVACNFVMDGVFLGGKISEYGLPNYITGYFNQLQIPLASFVAPNHICPGTCTNFTNHSNFATSYVWQFPGANPSVSTDENPTNICYNTPGSYSVTLIATNTVGSDTLTLNNYVTVYPAPAAQGILQNGDTLFANPGAVQYQWYMNGNMISGATDYFYVAQASGNYSVVATDDNSCEVEAVVNGVVAGINSPGSLNGHLSIYPDPVSDKLSIAGDAMNGTPAQITIYNSLGELMSVNADYNLRTVDCKSLSSGLYILELKSGDKIFRTKFLKQ
jgi:PKD repeat protein